MKFGNPISETTVSPFVNPEELVTRPFVVLSVRTGVETGEYGRKVHFGVGVAGLGRRTLSLSETPHRRDFAELLRVELVTSPAVGAYKLERSTWTDAASAEERSAWKFLHVDTDLGLEAFTRAA